ncbi:MAG: hypothetical protein MJZ38_07040 [archaeon]|nr:hypothetical protein [archaeon]
MTNNDYIALVLVYLIIVVALLVSLALERTGRFEGNTTRKIVHIGVGNFVFVWWMFTENWIMLVFFTIPFAILLFLAMFKGNAISNSKIGKISNEDGHRTGLFLYAVSITIMVAFFFHNWVAASIGIIAMTYGDAFGSLVGKRWGKHKIMHHKSVEGTLAVMFSTAIIAFIVIAFYSFLITNGYYVGNATPNLPVPVVCLLAGAVTAVLELLSPGQYDNLTIPTAVALVMVGVGL